MGISSWESIPGVWRVWGFSSKLLVVKSGIAHWSFPVSHDTRSVNRIHGSSLVSIFLGSATYSDYSIWRDCTGGDSCGSDSYIKTRTCTPSVAGAQCTEPLALYSSLGNAYRPHLLSCDMETNPDNGVTCHSQDMISYLLSHCLTWL